MSRKSFLYTAALFFYFLLAGRLAAKLKCDNTKGLKPEEIELRKSLKYTDTSPDPQKLCKNCALYVPPAKPNTCGGCTLIKGPIHPDGWCSAWVPMM